MFWEVLIKAQRPSVVHYRRSPKLLPLTSAEVEVRGSVSLVRIFDVTLLDGSLIASANKRVA